MTEQEKKDKLNEIRANMAFGGYDMTYETIQNLNALWDGKKTEEQLIKEIIIKHGGRT